MLLRDTKPIVHFGRQTWQLNNPNTLSTYPKMQNTNTVRIWFSVMQIRIDWWTPILQTLWSSGPALNIQISWSCWLIKLPSLKSNKKLFALITNFESYNIQQQQQSPKPLKDYSIHTFSFTTWMNWLYSKNCIWIKFSDVFSTAQGTGCPSW